MIRHFTSEEARQQQENWFGERYEITELFIDIRVRFGEIDRDDQLTPEDKKRITEFFLQNMIAPKARKLLEEHFPEDFRIKSSTSNHHPGSSKPTHQDR